MGNSKTGMVLKHLLLYKTITSWEAIQRYRATRLSAIIFNLKKKGYNIQAEMIYDTDRDGFPTRYAIYTLLNNTEEEPEQLSISTEGNTICITSTE